MKDILSNSLDQDKIVIVDFYAEWCGPCKALSPVLEDVAKEYNEKVILIKINVDEHGNLAQQYGIRGIPSLIFFKDKEVKSTLVGNQSKDRIKEVIDNL